MDRNLFDNMKKIDVGVTPQPVKDWKERYSKAVKPSTFCIVETAMGPKILYRNTMGQTFVTWPRKVDDRIVGVPNRSWIKEAVTEYFADPKAFMVKVAECDVPGTMQPQETPDIKAEDSSMEDYSETDDPSKLKDKTKDNDELATREVKDKELEQKPPETKESKVKEDNYRHDPEPRPESYKDEEGDTVYILPDVEFTDIKSTVRDALAHGYESFLYGRLGSGEGIANKDKTKVFWGADVQDHLPNRRDESRKTPRQKPRGYRIRESLRFCGSCNKTFRSNECKCKCGNEHTEVLGEREYSDMVGSEKPVFKVEYVQDGQKKEDRVTAFDEDDAKRYVERMKRGAKATKATKVTEGLASKAGKTPGDFDKDQLEAGTKVEMEHTDDANKARHIAMDHLTEDPEYYKKLKKMEAGACDKSSEAGKKTEEGKVPDDADPEDKKVQKLYENILELLDEMPDLTPGDVAAVKNAIASGAMSEDWPTDDEMIDQLSALEDIVDQKGMDPDVDVKMSWLKYVAVPKALTMAESKTNETNLNEPAGFESCVERGGRVRTITGPDKEHGLKAGEYVKYCYIGGKSFRGEVETKKNESKVNEDLSGSELAKEFSKRQAEWKTSYEDTVKRFADIYGISVEEMKARLNKIIEEPEKSESKVAEQGPVSAPGQMPPIPNKPAPGQKPESPEEKKKREALVSAAAKAVEAFGDDELEAYAEQIKKRQQGHK